MSTAYIVASFDNHDREECRSNVDIFSMFPQPAAPSVFRHEDWLRE